MTSGTKYCSTIYLPVDEFSILEKVVDSCSTLNGYESYQDHAICASFYSRFPKRGYTPDPTEDHKKELKRIFGEIEKGESDCFYNFCNYYPDCIEQYGNYARVFVHGKCLWWQNFKKKELK